MERKDKRRRVRGPDDSSPLEAFRREVIEELGRPTLKQFLKGMRPILPIKVAVPRDDTLPSKPVNMLHINGYIINGNKLSIEKNFHGPKGTEVTSLQWVKLDDAIKMGENGKLRKGHTSLLKEYQKWLKDEGNRHQLLTYPIVNLHSAGK